MNQVKFLKILTVILVILNMSVVSFLLFRQGPPRHHPPHHGKPLFQIIERKLNLDEQQKARYKILREEHRSQMIELDKSRNGLLKDYFKTLNQPGENESRLTGLMNEVKHIEQQRIDITYGHFNDVKALCREDQIAAFPEVMDIAIDHLLSTVKKRPPPPERK